MIFCKSRGHTYQETKKIFFFFATNKLFPENDRSLRYRKAKLSFHRIFIDLNFHWREKANRKLFLRKNFSHELCEIFFAFYDFWEKGKAKILCSVIVNGVLLVQRFRFSNCDLWKSPLKKILFYCSILVHCQVGKDEKSNQKLLF